MKTFYLKQLKQLNDILMSWGEYDRLHGIDNIRPIPLRDTIRQTLKVINDQVVQLNFALEMEVELDCVESIETIARIAGLALQLLQLLPA